MKYYLVNRYDAFQTNFHLKSYRSEILRYIGSMNYMIRLEIRHRGVMSLCAIEDKTAVVVVA